MAKQISIGNWGFWHSFNHDNFLAEQCFKLSSRWIHSSLPWSSATILSCMAFIPTNINGADDAEGLPRECELAVYKTRPFVVAFI